MLNTFGVIKANFKIKPSAIYISNYVFKLHYKITTLILLVATILVSSRQYIGEHIRCISDHGVPPHVIDTYCFFTATYTVIKYLNATLVDLEAVAHPGVGPFGPLGFNSPEPIIRHNYYQWVPFVLFGQAIMFHIPHLLWKSCEGGRMKMLVDGFKYAHFAVTENCLSVDGKEIPSKEMKHEMLQEVYENFMKRIYVNRSWSLNLTFCEFLNFLNLLLQIYITDKFLGGLFLRLGTEIMHNGIDASVDYLDVVFPKVTKCTFHKYGPSGSIQSHDAMCVMALNIINDKIYTFLWFWFVFLFVSTVLAILWRLVTYCLHARSHGFNRFIFSMTCPGRLNPWDVVTVTNHCSYTDWLFLYYLSKNMDGFVFRELLIGLAEALYKRDNLLRNANEEEEKEEANKD